MKQFGYPKEYNAGIPWSDRTMRIIEGKLFWGEANGYWWSEDGDEYLEKEMKNGKLRRYRWPSPSRR